MAVTTHTRRAALAAIAAAPVAALALPAAAQTGDDTELLRIWAQRQTAAAPLYDEWPDLSGEEEDERHLALSNEIAVADQAIMELTATTNEGRIAQLWVALCHAQPDRWLEEAISRSDFEAVAAGEEDLDFHARLIFGVIRSLERGA